MLYKAQVKKDKIVKTYKPTDWNWVAGKGIPCQAIKCKHKAMLRAKWGKRTDYVCLCIEHYNQVIGIGRVELREPRR